MKKHFKHRRIMAHFNNLTQTYATEIVNVYQTESPEEAQQEFTIACSELGILDPVSLNEFKRLVREALSINLNLDENTMPDWLEEVEGETAGLELPAEDPLLSSLAERLSAVYRNNADYADRLLSNMAIQYNLTPMQITTLKTMVRNIAFVRYIR